MIGIDLPIPTIRQDFYLATRTNREDIRTGKTKTTNYKKWMTKKGLHYEDHKYFFSSFMWLIFFFI